MKFHYRFYGRSAVDHESGRSTLGLAPDLRRPPVYLDAGLREPLVFREAISALHEVVISDLRTRPRDLSVYRAWLEQHEGQLLVQFMARGRELPAEIARIEQELRTLRTEKSRLLQPFFKAQREYFDWLYKSQRELWFLLDPVISVHPDTLLFECFSNDESSYASLSVDREQLEQQGEAACGTTNIDYSDALYTEFQKLRDYRNTRLKIQAEGFTVTHADDPALVEHKIEVPDSWVRGFLQVSSAMGLPMQRLRLHPMDLHNLCLRLRQRRERTGPRSLRMQLRAGKAAAIVLEPWNLQLELPRSVFEGHADVEIRLWGRRRLLTLERLIPLAQSIEVLLMGTGLPSFWVVQLPGMRFTLGLSGWTANDWSRLGQFDLLAPRGESSSQAQQQVWNALTSCWFASSAQLSRSTGLAEPVVASVLGLLSQQGKVMFDLGAGVWRLRELSNEPLPLAELRFASAQEAAAASLVNAGGVKKLQQQPGPEAGHSVLSAEIAETGRKYQTSLLLDADQRLVSSGCQCQCDHYVRHRLMRGPCPHMIALRLAAAQRAGHSEAA